MCLLRPWFLGNQATTIASSLNCDLPFVLSDLWDKTVFFLHDKFFFMVAEEMAQCLRALSDLAENLSLVLKLVGRQLSVTPASGQVMHSHLYWHLHPQVHINLSRLKQNHSN